MEIGEKVCMIPESFCARNDRGKPERRAIKGTVVYIHPLGRYYTVAFETKGGPIRESFRMVGSNG